MLSFRGISSPSGIKFARKKPYSENPESLSYLNLPPSILQWIISFLNGRTQQVKRASSVSSFKPINMGIVQGSGLGPTLYIVMASDLKPLSTNDILFKFAE